MDASNTTMTVTHLCIAWTLFGALLVWILLFAFLALRPEAKKHVATVEETFYSTTLISTPAPTMVHVSIAQPVAPSSHVHMYETANEAIHSA